MMMMTVMMKMMMIYHERNQSECDLKDGNDNKLLMRRHETHFEAIQLCSKKQKAGRKDVITNKKKVFLDYDMS